MKIYNEHKITMEVGYNMKNKEKGKVAFITLGCKVNQYETNAMAQSFIDSGYLICNEKENPDIIVVNTCTVTNIADRKSRQTLRKAKEKNQDTIVVAVRMLCPSCKK